MNMTREKVHALKNTGAKKYMRLRVAGFVRYIQLLTFFFASMRHFYHTKQQTSWLICNSPQCL